MFSQLSPFSFDSLTHRVILIYDNGGEGEGYGIGNIICNVNRSRRILDNKRGYVYIGVHL